MRTSPGQRSVWPGDTRPCVVFDLDGTLVDSRADIVAAVRFVLARYAAPMLPADEIAGFVGDGARLLLSRAFRLPPDASELDSIVAAFVEHYAEHATDRTTLRAGARATLEALDDLPLALCTNKPRAVTERVLRSLDLERHFLVLVAGGDLPERKPSPAPLVHIGATLSVPTDRLVMVGDGTQDVESGRAAGARTVGVLGGFATRAQLEGARPDVLIERIGDLPVALSRLGLRRPASGTPP